MMAESWRFISQNEDLCGANVRPDFLESRAANANGTGDVVALTGDANRN